MLCIALNLIVSSQKIVYFLAEVALFSLGWLTVLKIYIAHRTLELFLKIVLSFQKLSVSMKKYVIYL